jgi:hypothetical protein
MHCIRRGMKVREDREVLDLTPLRAVPLEPFPHRCLTKMHGQNDHQDTLSRCTAHPCVVRPHVWPMETLNGFNTRSENVRAAGSSFITSDHLACPHERARSMNIGEWEQYERGCIRHSSCMFYYSNAFDSASVNAHYRMSVFSSPR